MIRHLFFDVGGTLHTQHQTPEQDTEYLHRVLALLREYQIEPPETGSTFLQQIDAGAKRYKSWSEEHLIELPSETIWTQFILHELPHPERLAGLGEALSYQYDRWRKEIRPRPHLFQTLYTLHCAGYQLGIISNIMSRSYVPFFLKEYGIANFFRACILSSECGKRKPDPEPFAQALQEQNASIEESCYIGDTLSRDVLGARRSNWPWILQIDNPLTYHRDREQKHAGLQPDLLVHDLIDILPALKKHNQRLEVSS